MKVLNLILFFSMSMIACKDQQNINIRHDEKYERSKQVLYEAEKKSPIEFIDIKYSNKKNVVGKTVVNGTIFNHAKVVAYKDFEIKIQFYSKTGTLVEEEVETIFEEVSPGGARQFKSKFMAPKSADSVVVKLLSAKIR